MGLLLLLLLCMRLRASLVMVAAVAVLPLLGPSSAQGPDAPDGPNIGVPPAGLTLPLPLPPIQQGDMAGECWGPEANPQAMSICGDFFLEAGSIETVYAVYCGAGNPTCHVTNGGLYSGLAGEYNGADISWESNLYNIVSGANTGMYGCWLQGSSGGNPNWYDWVEGVLKSDPTRPVCTSQGGWGATAVYFDED